MWRWIITANSNAFPFMNPRILSFSISLWLALIGFIVTRSMFSVIGLWMPSGLGLIVSVFAGIVLAIRVLNPMQWNQHVSGVASRSMPAPGLLTHFIETRRQQLLRGAEALIIAGVVLSQVVQYLLLPSEDRAVWHDVLLTVIIPALALMVIGVETPLGRIICQWPWRYRAVHFTLKIVLLLPVIPLFLKVCPLWLFIDHGQQTSLRPC